MNATTKGPIIDPALCRCCRAIKKCRVLTAEYTWQEQKEIYADMIMDCFGILLSHVDGNDKESGVCATCVVRLRDACAFRHQVLQCEELFLGAKLEDKEHEDTKNHKSVQIELKLEPEDDVSDSAATLDHDAGLSMGYSTDYLEEKKPKIEDKLEPSFTNSDPPNFNDDDSASSSDSDKPLKRKRKAAGTEKKVTEETVMEKKIKIGTTEKAAKTPKKQPVAKVKNYDRDLDCMAKENLLTIIQYSYICPFKNRWNNYYCFYCKEYYPKPEDLREHTLSHDTKPFEQLMSYTKTPKLDITRIDCKLCPLKIDDLNVFKQHVDQEHGKKIYFEAPDKMVLFRLTWNDLVCVVCSNVFEDFNMLNTHMIDTHFSNFTCDMCGMCFLEKSQLDTHLKRHKDDEKHPCEICGKVFKSNHNKDMHVDIVHKKKAIIRCPRCDECFRSYALKNKHLAEAHGQKKTFPCNLCDKVCNRQTTLTEHQRRHHQKVLKHQCEYCDQRFYLPSRLKDHMAMHTSESNFRCEHCDKTYPRLKSLQHHIRTHTNDKK